MSTKWSSQVLGKSGAPDFGELLKDEFTVILLQGKNVFDDMIYCYVKMALPDVAGLQAALKSDAGFNPSDFGTVVAAGKGEPPEEVQAEVAATYNIFTKPKSSSDTSETSGGTNDDEKKAWDEY